MNQKYMKEKVQKFIDEFILNYNLDVENVVDRHELSLAIESIELQDCLCFLQNNEINVANYPLFRKLVLQEVRKILKKEGKSKKEENNNWFETVINQIDDTHSSKASNNYWFERLMIRFNEEYSLLTDIQKEKINDIIIDKLNRDILSEEVPRENMKEWVMSKLKTYKIPQGLENDLYQRFVLNRAKIESNNFEIYYNNILDANEEVTIQKRNKKGIVCGYIIKNDSERKVVSDKESLKKFLNKGYHFECYQIKERKRLHEIITEQRREEIKRTIKKPKKKWKKYALIASLISVLGGAKLIYDRVTEDSNITIENTIDMNNILNQMPKINIEETDFISNVIPNQKENQTKEKISILPEQEKIINEFEQELNLIPASYAKYTITEDAKIHRNLTTEKQKGQDPYFGTDLERQNNGYVLLDQDGTQYIYTNPSIVVELLQNENYTYVGSRAINEYSFDNNGNFLGYEGLYSKENIQLLENEDTLLDEIKKQEKTRTLTRN